MRTRHWLIAIVLICIPVAIVAQPQQPAAPDLPDAAFIEPGNDYHIHFPDDRNPFMHVFTEITESFSKLPDGRKTNVRNTPVTVTIRSDIFHVLQLHGESWVLVEHPASTNDYPKWSGKHRAVFLLRHPASLDAEQLANVNEAAACDIKLTQTWVNLSHAVTVKPVSAQSLNLAE